MDPSLLIQLGISAVGLLCCCAFWAVVGFLAYRFISGRGGDGAAASASTANKIADSAPSASAPAEDEMETVVAPATPKAEAPKPEAKDAPGRPPPRSAGATIIAFDDDFDED